MLKKIIGHRFFDLLIILIIGLISITWFRGDFIIKNGDSFFSLSPSDALKRYSYVWYFIPGVGVPGYGSVLYIPYFSFLVSLEKIGFSLITSEKIWVFFVFTISGLSMYYLSSTLLNGDHRIAALVSSVFYMMNPFGLTSIWSTGLLPIIHFYSIYPLILALFINWIKKRNYIYLFTFLFFQIISSVFNTHPGFTFIMWVTLFFYLLFASLKIEKSNIIQAIRFASFILALWFFLSLWWILPMVPFIGERLMTAELSGSPTDIFIHASQTTSFLNVIRLLGAWTLYINHFPDPNFPWFKTYNTTLFIIISFLIPILSFSALLVKPNDRNVVFFSLLAVVIVFLLKGAHSPFGEINIWLLNTIPFAGIFRNHYEKIGMILVLCYSFLIGVNVDSIFKHLKISNMLNNGKIISNIFVILIMILINVIYVFPFWTGDVILSGGEVIPDSRIKVPAYYDEAKEWFKEQRSDFRLFYLPSLPPKGPAYEWEHGYFGQDPLDQDLLINKGILGYSLTGYKYVDDFQRQIIDSLHQNTSVSISKMFALANIRYILLHNDFNLKYSPTTSPEQLQVLLSSQKKIHLEKSFGKLAIYKISDGYLFPHIYPASTTFLINGSIDGMFQLVASGNFTIGKNVIFLSTQTKEEQWRFLKEYANAVFIDKKIINTQVYDNLEKSFDWSDLPIGSIEARHYTGLKAIIRTDGKEQENTLSFPSSEPYSSDLTNLQKPNEISSSPAITFKKINPTKYLIKIENSTGPFFLVFLELYNPLWKAYAQDKSIMFDEIIAEYQDVNVKEAKHDWYKFTLQDVSFLFAKSLDGEYHFMANGYANAWYIDPNEIDKDSDGEFTMTLYFLPQSLFYIGLIVSGLTFIGCIGYLFYDGRKTKPSSSLYDKREA